MRRGLAGGLLAIAACSYPALPLLGDAGTDGRVPDGRIPDGPLGDGGGGPSITISGTVISSEDVVIDGETVAAFAVSNPGVALATTTTAGSGSYALTVATGGGPLDCFVEASGSGFPDTFVWPPAALTTNIVEDIPLLVPSDETALASACGTTVNAGDALVGVQVLDGTTGVSGADLTAGPVPIGKICYEVDGEPTGSATATDSTGTAIIFNVPPGDVTLSAVDSTGTQFSSVTIDAAGGTLATTEVLEL